MADISPIRKSKLQQKLEEFDGRPVVKLQRNNTERDVTNVEAIVTPRAIELGLFERAGERDLVRIVALDNPIKNAIWELPQGLIVTRAITSSYLKGRLEGLINFERYDRRKGEYLPGKCPTDLVNFYLEKIGERRLPLLTGTIEAPLMRGDGSILSKPGYDSETGLYLVSDIDWSGIPASPTREDALNALEILKKPFSEFPYIDGPSRTIALAHLLTGFQRRQLISAPLFAYAATASRSGKSLQAKCVGIILTGRVPAATHCDREKNEFRKAIASVLFAGYQVVNFDNIEHEVDSDALCKALTEPTYSDRILGASQMLVLPTNVLFSMTGHRQRMGFRGDLTTRVVLSTIDPKLERPEERTFQIPDLLDYCAKNRRELVIAALTILRAYFLAGRPKPSLPVWGGFEQWSDEIRAPLVWLGCADPYRTRDQVLETDENRELLRELLQSWYAKFDSYSDTVKAAFEYSRPGQANEVRDIMIRIGQYNKFCTSNGFTDINLNLSEMGKWIRRYALTTIDGLRFVQPVKPDGSPKTQQRAQVWQVEVVSPDDLPMELKQLYDQRLAERQKREERAKRRGGKLIKLSGFADTIVITDEPPFSLSNITIINAQLN
jgi:putative DNA primase/helicase